MVTINLDNVDWALLREQKEWLDTMVFEGNGDNETLGYAEGLLSLLDEIQDQAALVLGEFVVFRKR